MQSEKTQEKTKDHVRPTPTRGGFKFVRKGSRWAHLNISKPGEKVPATKKHTKEAVLKRAVEEKKRNGADTEHEAENSVVNPVELGKAKSYRGNNKRRDSFPEVHILEARHYNMPNTIPHTIKDNERIEEPPVSETNLGQYLHGQSESSVIESDGEFQDENAMAFATEEESGSGIESDNENEDDLDDDEGDNDDDKDSNDSESANDSLFHPLPSLSERSRPRSAALQEQREQRSIAGINPTATDDSQPDFMLPVRSRQKRVKDAYNGERNNISYDSYESDEESDTVSVERELEEPIFGKESDMQSNDIEKSFSGSRQDIGDSNSFNSSNGDDENPNEFTAADHVQDVMAQSHNRKTAGKRLSQRRNGLQRKTPQGNDKWGNAVNNYFLSEHNEHAKRKIKTKKVEELRQKQKEWQEFKRSEKDLSESLAFFKTENEKLKKGREELTVARQQLGNEKIEFQRHMDQEKQQFKNLKEAEMGKIMREKKVMERQYRANMVFSARKEQEKQTEKLRQELDECKETCRKKDIKHRSAMERMKRTAHELRERIKELEEQLKQIELQRIDQMLVEKDKSLEQQQQQFDSNVKGSPSLSKKMYKNVHRLKRQDDAANNELSPEEFQRHVLGEDGHRDEYEDGDEFDNEDNSWQYMEQFSPSIRQGEANPIDNMKTNIMRGWFDIESRVEALCRQFPCKDYSQEPEAWYHPLEATESHRTDRIVSQARNDSGRQEVRYSSGKVVINYPNRTVKKLFPDGINIVAFANGDVKKTYPEGRIVYFYGNANTVQITYLHGVEVFRFENGQTELFFPDGTKEVIFPGGATYKYIAPDGYEQIVFTEDGVVQLLTPDRTRIITYQDGRVERYLPGGTLEMVYPDESVVSHSLGSSVVRVQSGRVLRQSIKS